MVAPTDLKKDLIIIAIFIIFSIIATRDIIQYDFAIWDLLIPNYDAMENLGWAFEPINSLGIGGAWIPPTYLSIISSFLTMLVGNISAAKIITILPLPLSFALFLLSSRFLFSSTLVRVVGALTYSLSPIIFSIFFSPGQQLFYALLPVLLTLTYKLANEIISNSKFPLAPIIGLSICYSLALSFMIQGLLLLIPATLIIVAVVSFRRRSLFVFSRKLIYALAIAIPTIFALLLPYALLLILPTFNFFISGDFSQDKYQTATNTLYQQAIPSNYLRLAGAGGFHMDQLGFNKVSDLNNLVLLYSIVMISIPISYFLKKTFTSHFRFLLVCYLIFSCSIVVLELGRLGILWDLPLSSVFRSPIKPMMLLAISLSFISMFAFNVIESKINRRAVNSGIVLALIALLLLYNANFLGGSVWIKPEHDYWKNLGYQLEWRDAVITPSMQSLVDFYKEEVPKDYRYYVFPSMPTQTLYLSNNIPLANAIVYGATNAEAKYLNYSSILNEMILRGDRQVSSWLSPIAGRYIAVIDDTNSLGYSGPPRYWGGIAGALTGNSTVLVDSLNKIPDLKLAQKEPYVFVNNNALSKISSTDKLIVVDGDFTTLSKIYDYVNVTGPIIPVFKDDISSKQFNELIGSGIVGSVVHDRSSGETDSTSNLSFVPIKNYYHTEPLIQSTGQLMKQPNPSVTLTQDESLDPTLTMRSPLTDGLMYLYYTPARELNMQSVSDITLSMTSNLDHPRFRVSFFDADGRQLLFDLEGGKANEPNDYKISPSNGISFDRDGVTVIPSIDKQHVIKVQLGIFLDSSNLSTPEVKFTTRDLQITKLSSLDNSNSVLNLGTFNGTEKYGAVWLKSTDGNVPAKVIMDDKEYEMRKNNNNILSYSFSYADLKGENLKLVINNQDLDQFKEVLIGTSNSPINNLNQLVLSTVHQPKLIQKSDTRYLIDLSQDGDRLLLLSQLFDKNWETNSNIHIPVYGFLNGFVLTGSDNVILEYSIQDQIVISSVILVLSWIVVIYILLRSSITSTIKSAISLAKNSTLPGKNQKGKF